MGAICEQGVRYGSFRAKNDSCLDAFFPCIFDNGSDGPDYRRRSPPTGFHLGLRECAYADFRRSTIIPTLLTFSRFWTAVINSSECFAEMVDFALLRNFPKTSSAVIGFSGWPLAILAV